MPLSPNVEVREILHPALQPVYRRSREGPFSASDDNYLGVRINNSTGIPVIYTVTNRNPSDSSSNRNEITLDIRLLEWGGKSQLKG